MLEYFKDIDKFQNLFISSLPSGYLYNDSLKPFIKGFLEIWQDEAKKLDKAYNDLFIVNEANMFLDEYLSQYNLPNEFFDDVSSTEKKVFAITMMRLANTLESKEDYTNFMLLLGYQVQFYHYQNTVAKHHLIGGLLPMILGGLPEKKKLTWLVFIQDDSPTPSGTGNIGSPLPMVLGGISDRQEYAKKILDYIKPYDIIFKYISLEEKINFGL